MIGRLAFVIVVCVLASLGAGCAATPPSHFYTLRATATPVTTASSLSLAVGPVSVPAVVDRPEIVVTAGPNQVWLDEFNRWASPLQDNLSRVIAENLAAVMGTPHVTQFPQALNTGADYRVAIEVLRFGSTPGEAAMLDAVWTVRRTQDGKTETRRTTAREAVREQGYDALAAAHSRAAARLSQDIADEVRALDHPAQ